MTPTIFQLESALKLSRIVGERIFLVGDPLRGLEFLTSSQSPTGFARTRLGHADPSMAGPMDVVIYR